MLRALPEDQQEAWAKHIELALQGGDSLLTDEQWAEVDRRLSDDDKVVVPHEEVVARMRAKYGG